RAGARHGRRALDAGRVRVHAEFGAQRRTDGVVTLAEDAVAVPILAQAVPHHHEASVRGRGHSRGALYVGGIRVDLAFRATRIAARIVSLREDAVGAPVLAVALPDDDE